MTIQEKVLSTKDRKELPDSEFALSGGRYPIPDEAHARNALARAAQELKAGKLSKAEHDTIVRKVKSRFPDIKVSEEEEDEEIANPSSEVDPETEIVSEEEDQVQEEDEGVISRIGVLIDAPIIEEVKILEDTGTGLDWRVVLIAPGISKNRTYYSPSLLQRKASMFEGVKAFADHNIDNPTNRSIKEVIGWYDNAKYETGKGVTADFHALESQSWFSGMLREAVERGKPDLFGFSINGLGSKRLGKVNNETCYVVEDLLRMDSVDAVINPSAGGRVLRIAAGEDTISREEIDLIDKLTLEELKETRPDLYESIVNGAVSDKDEEIKRVTDEMSTLRQEMETLKAEKATVVAQEEDNASKVTSEEEDKKIMEEEKNKAENMTQLEEQMTAAAARLEEMVKVAEEKAKVAECKAVLAEALSSSELPAPVQKKIQRRYSGKTFEVADLEAEIADEKAALEEMMSDNNTPFTRTAPAVTVGDNERDRAVKALDGFFEGKNVDNVPAARTLTEAYAIFTGKNSWEITPQNLISEAARGYDSELRITEALSAGSWAEVLGDSITRKMLKDYNDLPYDDWRALCEVVPVNDFRTQRRTRFGGYGLLPTVTEQATYAAMTSPGDEETTYSPSKRGGTENITLEMIAKDDVGSIRRIPNKLARAAKITLYRFVFDMISLTGAGAVTLGYDSTKLFTAAHANSLVTSTAMADAALNDANLLTAKQKLAKQAAYGESTHIPGFRPKYLITSIDNEAQAIRLRDNDVTVSGDAAAADRFRTDVNVHRGTFELITVPYWLDDIDSRGDRWVVMADPNDIPTIEVGFFQGQEAPQLFVQDMQNVGSMFNNDTLTYKIRHIYGGTILDHRGFVGSALFA